MILVAGMLFAGSSGNYGYSQSHQITSTNQKSLEVGTRHIPDSIMMNVLHDSTGMQNTQMDMMYDTTGMKNGKMKMKHDSASLENGHMDMMYDTTGMKNVHMDMKHDSMSMKKERMDCDSTKMKEVQMKKEVIIDTTKTR